MLLQCFGHRFLKKRKCHNSEVFNLMKNYNCSCCFQYLPIKEDGLRFFPSRRKLRKLHSLQPSPHLFVSKSYKPTKCQELNAKVGNLSSTYALAIFFFFFNQDLKQGCSFSLSTEFLSRGYYLLFFILPLPHLQSTWFTFSFLRANSSGVLGKNKTTRLVGSQGTQRT